MYMPLSRTQAAVQNLGMTLRDIAAMKVGAESAAMQGRLRMAELGIKRAGIQAEQDISIAKEISARERTQLTLEQRAAEAAARRQREQRMEATASESNRIRSEQLSLQQSKEARDKRANEGILVGEGMYGALLERTGDKSAAEQAMKPFRDDPVIGHLLNTPTTRGRLPEAVRWIATMSAADKRARQSASRSGIPEIDRLSKALIAVRDAQVRLGQKEGITGEYLATVSKENPTLAAFLTMMGPGGSAKKEDTALARKALGEYASSLTERINNIRLQDKLGGANEALRTLQEQGTEPEPGSFLTDDTGAEITFEFDD